MKLSLLALIALLLAGPMRAADDPYSPWMKHFYANQDVGPFDGFWKMVVKDRILENKNAAPPVMGFVGQVLHRHPDLIKGRLDDPRSFPPNERVVLLTLLWLSDTPEARAVLERSNSAEFLAHAPPPASARDIKTGGDLDFCWGSYFATGDTAALDPIIATLDLGQYAGALKRYPTSKKTEEDKAAAMKDAIFGAAMWSLIANGSDDPRIAKHIRIALFDSKTPKPRAVWLGVLFARTSPDVSPEELAANKAGH
jgi:hypothetical protein